MTICGYRRKEDSIEFLILLGWRGRLRRSAQALAAGEAGAQAREVRPWQGGGGGGRQGFSSLILEVLVFLGSGTFSFTPANRILIKVLLKPGKYLQRTMWFQDKEPEIILTKTLELALPKTKLLLKHKITPQEKKQKPKNKPTGSYTKILQGPSENYADFLTRLKTAISRTVIGEKAKRQLKKLLANENANQECQKAVAPIHETETIIDYLKACRNLRSETQKMQMLAETMVVRAPGTSLMPPSHVPTTSQMSTDYETIWWQALNGYSTNIFQSNKIQNLSSGMTPPPQFQLCPLHKRTPSATEAEQWCSGDCVLDLFVLPAGLANSLAFRRTQELRSSATWWQENGQRAGVMLFAGTHPKGNPVRLPPLSSKSQGSFTWPDGYQQLRSLILLRVLNIIALALCALHDGCSTPPVFGVQCGGQLSTGMSTKKFYHKYPYASAQFSSDFPWGTSTVEDLQTSDTLTTAAMSRAVIVLQQLTQGRFKRRIQNVFMMAGAIAVAALRARVHSDDVIITNK
ncbi:hypothetical protein Celaphus_00011328, partial [Cervus elaphus hippelaphus]